MKERGIRFVMFEAPNKESVYAEYMPDSVRVYGSESRLDAALPERTRRRDFRCMT